MVYFFFYFIIISYNFEDGKCEILKSKYNNIIRVDNVML